MYPRIAVPALGALLVAGCGSSATSSNSAAYGKSGAVASADRTVAVHILSPLRGETVVFKVSNDTTGIHEFVLGNSKVQGDYQKSMTSMGPSPMLMGDQPNIVDMQPGDTKQLAWTFPSTGKATVIYGSHEPGDYSHGLKGLVTVGGAVTASAWQ
ncbi:MAG: hypothetical protein M3063_03860 [Actinomycetota bacterium]|nr:hypothetical protein [Actinomycetota bacterium]